jgi:hypothetical protein
MSADAGDCTRTEGSHYWEQATHLVHLLHLLLQHLLLLQRRVLGIAGKASCGLHAKQLLLQLQEAAKDNRTAPPAVLPPYSDPIVSKQTYKYFDV